MPAYLVAIRNATKDSRELQIYRSMSPAGNAGHNIDVLAASGKFKVVEGDSAESVVLARFPTFDEAIAWYYSDAYQAAAAHRLAGGDYRSLIIEAAS
jgi:uncharacterized protein (DUF1330 family)